MGQNRRKRLKSTPFPTSLFLRMGRKELCVWEETTRQAPGKPLFSSAGPQHSALGKGLWASLSWCKEATGNVLPSFMYKHLAVWENQNFFEMKNTSLKLYFPLLIYTMPRGKMCLLAVLRL